MAPRINARDREALRALPRLMQRKIDGALRGSVEDLRDVVGSLNQLKDVTPLLLPVFHAQLEAYPIPDRISPDVVPVIMLAKWSMGGIVQICHNLGSNISIGERIVHDAVASKWEMLFPWMQFFSNNFLPPSQRPAALPHGLSVSTYEALRITIHPLSTLCQFTTIGRQLMRTNPTVQAFFFRAWVIVDGLKSDDVADPLREGDKNLSALIRANMCSLSVICMEDTPASLPVSIISSVAGGTLPMASLALRYIRRMTKEVSNMPEPRLRARENVDFSSMTVCATGLAQAILFMQSLGDREGGCHELLLQIGSIRTVLSAITTLWERLLTPAWNSSDNEPDIGLAARRRVLYIAYRYIGYSMNCANDSALVISQAIQHGLLECLLRTGSSPAEHVDNTKRFEDDHDIQLLKELPRFFRLDRLGLEERASQDPVLWELWQAVDSAARTFTNFHELPEGAPFYRYQCCSPKCSLNFSEDDVTAYRCSGCMLTRYCSKYCQKEAWESGHRVHCRMLRSALGNQDVREIRKSLPVIAMIESWICEERVNEIRALDKDVVKTSENDRSIVEVDLTVYPIELNMYSLRDYFLVSGSHTFEREVAESITTSEDSPYDLVAVKVRLGREYYSLFSPATALGVAFGWTSGIQGGRYIHEHPRTPDP
ncbi:uncharacterized protein F5891DRAFT_1065372 [Suillus fuscotomentosus]|uniref:MYND-type domain-containing protein n=1 Tax=Suillus fuscotomentosus TaxID=1912939 RepID=A0AAD4DTV0_9AGAM|nr:uncharacterized protein F5891DRAFT_1065372 [Suillus fuscotomentosus]KAG1893732.1 hypothetical protein F5891DRAFT_1065372 [Suillus fuscotomentosus]